MAEIKQTNFRLDQETVEKFRKFCDDNGMNQAEGFDYVVQLIDVNKTMVAAPGRRTEIESFQKLLKDMMQLYLKSVDICTETEARVRNKYLALIESKDVTISDLQEKIKGLEDGYDQARATSEAAAKAAAQAVKDATAAQKQADTADQLCSEKDETITALKEKLADHETLKAANESALERLAEMEALRRTNEDLNRILAENKAEAARKIEDLTSEFKRKAEDAEREHSDALKAAARELQVEKDAAARALADAAKDHEVALRELQAQMERKISDAEKDAALAAANATAEKEREMTALLREADKENARLQARIELLEERIKSLQASISK